jgi:hypothetical protein
VVEPLAEGAGAVRFNLAVVRLGRQAAHQRAYQAAVPVRMVADGSLEFVVHPLQVGRVYANHDPWAAVLHDLATARQVA